MPATPTFRTTTRHMLKESKTYASQTLMGGLSGFESPIGLDRRDRLSALNPVISASSTLGTSTPPWMDRAPA